MSKLGQFKVNHRDLIQLYRQALSKPGAYDKVDAKVQHKVARLMVSSKIEKKQDQEHEKKLINKVPAVVRLGANFLPAMMIVIGFLLLGSAVVPIIGFYLKNLPQMQADKLLSPVPQEKILDVTPLVIAQGFADDDYGEKIKRINTGPVIVDAELDYTNLSNWFDDGNTSGLSNRTSLLSKQAGEYILSIPKLEVENAIVKIGGTNLEESLIQYPGTSLPGKPGGPVIFGHSLLRQFYNPKESNPRRYNTIFSTIMTLEKGEKIYLQYGDVRYAYMVQDKTEVKPTDTYILSQDYSLRQLKLVTCVPEGTYLKRGVVTAQLVKE
jgi:LPXTG-site transpeptidase (sortase) family protein